jgi:hypothetical protein
MSTASYKRREKMFGEGRLLPLDRNAKVRVAAYARALTHRTEKGKHYGELTDKFNRAARAAVGLPQAGNGRCFRQGGIIHGGLACNNRSKTGRRHPNEASRPLFAMR